jgi:hypothetical protein
MADIKQMPLRMPRDIWEAARRKAGPNSLNAWIVDLIANAVADERTSPEPSLLDPEPLATGGFVEASLRREAEASARLDGETHPVDAHPVAESMDGTRRHLHRFKDTGRVLRYERGRAVPERQCECGATAEA